MKINLESGEVELTSLLMLRPGMTRCDVLALNAIWEEWDVVDNIAWSFRTIIKLPNKGISPKTVFVAHVGLDNSPMTFWSMAPWDLIEGTQSRPDGKYTKRLRTWFKEMFGTNLPVKREWGHIDASFDPWNQSATITCNYRERFDTDEKWQEYKKTTAIKNAS